MIRTSNSKIIKKAELIAKALEDDAEEILLHAERLVKAALKPTDQVKALRKIENKMSNEGVEVAFQKKVTKTAMKKTASVESLTEEEVNNLVDTVVEAIVDELEASLKEADEIAEEELKKIYKDEKKSTPEERQELEAKLKRTFERKAAAIGINAKLSRNHRVKKASNKRRNK